MSTKKEFFCYALYFDKNNNIIEERGLNIRSREYDKETAYVKTYEKEEKKTA